MGECGKEEHCCGSEKLCRVAKLACGPDNNVPYDTHTQCCQLLSGRILSSTVKKLS